MTVTVQVPAGAQPGDWRRLSLTALAPDDAAGADRAELMLVLDTTGPIQPPPIRRLIYLPLVVR